MAVRDFVRITFLNVYHLRVSASWPHWGAVLRIGNTSLNQNPLFQLGKHGETGPEQILYFLVIWNISILFR